jgi:hypothetical protein
MSIMKMALTLAHYTPNLIFQGRIGVTRVINTLGSLCAHTPLLQFRCRIIHPLKSSFSFLRPIEISGLLEDHEEGQISKQLVFQDEQIQIPMEVQWHKSVGKQCKHLLLLEQWPNK